MPVSYCFHYDGSTTLTNSSRGPLMTNVGVTCRGNANKAKQLGEFQLGRRDGNKYGRKEKNKISFLYRGLFQDILFLMLF